MSADEIRERGRHFGVAWCTEEDFTTLLDRLDTLEADYETLTDSNRLNAEALMDAEDKIDALEAEHAMLDALAKEWSQKCFALEAELREVRRERDEWRDSWKSSARVAAKRQK